MVDRLQTFWIDYKRFGSVTQRQGGRTKDTLKAGPGPTPTPLMFTTKYKFYYLTAPTLVPVTVSALLRFLKVNTLQI